MIYGRFVAEKDLLNEVGFANKKSKTNYNSLL
jgi:hypothetical protein